MKIASFYSEFGAQRINEVNLNNLVKSKVVTIKAIEKYKFFLEILSTKEQLSRSTKQDKIILYGSISFSFQIHQFSHHIINQIIFKSSIQ